MADQRAAVTLSQRHFHDGMTELATYDEFTVSAFRYSTGVCALRLANAAGWIDCLPFQGQQIWDAWFLGRRLTMGSMFPEPRPTLDYLSTYGAFLIHCGATGMGHPGPTDDHPLHGELPNAPYQSARLLMGRDDTGPYVGLTGAYQHTVAFAHNYVARPTLRLYPGSLVRLDLTIANLRHAPMDLMYLAHVNFRPVDGGRLVDARPVEPRVFTPGQAFDPELVARLDPVADATGWAHSLQLHPDGGADVVSHRPDQLPVALLWISRTIDQEALGLALPATAEADGYAAAKAKGDMVTLAPGETFACSVRFGALPPRAAAELAEAVRAT
ncbi:DUF4432 family protein [Asanoa sp. NPDC050611]|uniref:DUF4432 family protein n=1 Tax=Asanoa sp. NPDC050611 TaxID=3157098 RepID=UPI0033D17883